MYICNHIYMPNVFLISLCIEIICKTKWPKQFVQQFDHKFVDMIATPWPPRIGTGPNFLSSTWMSQKSCMHGCGMVIFFFHVMLFTHCKHRCCKHAGILPSSAMCLPWLKRLHAHGHENTNLSCSIFNIENVWKHCIHGKDAISECWHIPVKPCWQSQNFNQSQQFSNKWQVPTWNPTGNATMNFKT